MIANNFNFQVPLETINVLSQISKVGGGVLLKMDNFDTAYNVTSDNSQELDLGSAVLSVGGLAPGVDSLHVKSAAMIGNPASIGSLFGRFSVVFRLLFGCFLVAFLPLMLSSHKKGAL